MMDVKMNEEQRNQFEVGGEQEMVGEDEGVQQEDIT